MKTNWQIKKIKEVVEIQNGFAFKSSDYTNSGFFVMRITNVQDGLIKLNNPKYIKKINNSLDNFILNENDILMSLTGNVGRVGIIKKEHLPAVLNQRVARIKILDEKKLDHTFLFYFLKSPDFFNKVVGGGKGVAQQNVSTKDIEKLEIPLPPIQVQKQIVKILNNKLQQLKEAQELRDYAIFNTEKILSKTLDEIFKEGKNKGWEEKKLSEVCEKITDGTHQTPTYYDNGILFLSSKNVVGGKIDWDDIKYIDQKQHIEMHKRVAPSLGDILLAKNGTTGVGAIVDRNVTFDIYVSLALLRAKSVILPHFLLHFINSPIAKNQFNQRLKGAGVPNLHLNEIREVKIWFPKSLSDQQKIVIKLDNLSEKIKKLKELQNSQLEDFYKLEKAYLKEAFNSELI